MIFLFYVVKLRKTIPYWYDIVFTLVKSYRKSLIVSSYTTYRSAASQLLSDIKIVLKYKFQVWTEALSDKHFDTLRKLYGIIHCYPDTEVEITLIIVLF